MDHPRILSDEELLTVKEYLIFPFVLDVLERDIKLLKKTEVLKMSVLYAMKLKDVMNKLTSDSYFTREKLRKSGIKIISQEQTKDTLNAEYMVRGYKHTISMLWWLIKSEVQIVICRYLEIDIGDEKLR
jgi:hypothetical protein